MWHSRSDRAAHGLVRDAQEPRSDLLEGQLVVLTLVDLLRELGEQRAGSLNVQRLVLVRPEDLREVLRQETAQEEVRISNGQRATLAVACGAGVSRCRLRVRCCRLCISYLWADDKHAVAVEETRAAACSNGVDVELRCLDDDCG